MTNSQPPLRPDPVSAAFASALDGDVRGEDQLRALAVHHDRAVDALFALVSREALGDPSPVRPADVAATDQMIAAVLETVTNTDL